MSEQGGEKLTQLLAAAGDGDSAARERLWRLVYDELRGIAHHQMTLERPGAGLQTTVLVHEAYLRLLGPDGRDAALANRRQFFAAAAEAMRRIRVDDARRRGRLKRGGDKETRRHGDKENAVAVVFDADPAEALAVDEALSKLEAVAPRQAQIVKLRYFAGLTVDETAEALEVSPRTVDAEWRMARAWLFRALGPEP